jgi:hypothetical protein
MTKKQAWQDILKSMNAPKPPKKPTTAPSKGTSSEPIISKCNDCDMIVGTNAVALIPHKEYCGLEHKRKQDRGNIHWVHCMECGAKAEAEVFLVSRKDDFTGTEVENEFKRRSVKRENVYAEMPGMNYFGADYKAERKRQVNSVKALSWIEKIQIQCREEIKDEIWEAKLEVPGAWGDAESEAREIVTIRTMQRLGRDWRFLYRGKKYKYRDYEPGKYAEMCKAMKEGRRCALCGGYFDKQYPPFTRCAECIK